MNTATVLGIAALPILFLAIVFVCKAIGWQRRVIRLESELERVQQELRTQQGKLELAKQEFEKFTKFFEERIWKRTQELKEAQDELSRVKRP